MDKINAVITGVGGYVPEDVLDERRYFEVGGYDG